MKDLPLVSVVAVCYNHAKYVIETLDSIKNQTYQNIELIIMDDCSTDHSVEVIEDWITKNKFDCKFIAHQENKGLCATLNEALTLINGEYYQGIACDDILLPNKFENQVSDFLSLDDDYAVIYSDAFLMDEYSKTLYGRFIQRHKPQMLKVPTGSVYNELLNSNYIPAMSVLIKTKIVREFGSYDESISYEDYDLWLRLSKLYKFYFSETITCKYRIHDTNMHTSESFKNRALINSFFIYSKHIDNTIALNKLNKIIIKMYQNGIYKKYKGEILSLNLKSKMMYFIKKDISYKNYKRLLRVKRIIDKLA